MTAWYAVQAKAKQEAVAEYNLENQKFTTFLPLLRVSRCRGGRRNLTEEALFPGYLFVELDLEQQNIAPIRSTRGVLRLVQQGHELASVPTCAIHALQKAQEQDGTAIEQGSLFSAGDEVKLVGGPFDGLNAIFKAENSQERVLLLLSILGNETLINVSPSRITHAT